MLRTLESVTDYEIAAAPCITVVVGDAEPVFISPPVAPVSEDDLPGLILLTDSIEAAERRVEQLAIRLD